MTYIPQLYDFLRRLNLNNNRPWFQANKPEFDHLRALWFDDLTRFIAAVSQWWPEVARLSPAQCAYRIYRDTRFSPDKTPYKVYFSAAVCPQGKSAMRPGLYIHLAPDVERNITPSGLYGGLWNPDSALLKKMRQAIVDNADEWLQIDADMRPTFPEWFGDRLKKAPAGYPVDHPMIDYLRLKSYGKFLPLGEDFFSDPDWPERAADILKPNKPLIDFINYTIDE